MERLTDEQRRRVEVTAPLVKWMAGKMPGMGEWDDRVQDGYVGLIRAARGYQEEGGKWSGYAAVCIRGEMLEGARRRRRRFRDLPHEEVPLDGRRELVDPDPTPERLILDREAVRSVLAALSVRERRLVLARAAKAQYRLAEAEGVTESAVALRWRNSREAIRSKARRQLEDPD